MYGGGIATQVAPRPVDTIVAGNTLTSSSGSGADIYGSVLAASSYDLIGNGTDLSGISNGVNHNLIGTTGPPSTRCWTRSVTTADSTQTMPFQTRESRRGEGRRRHHADGCRQRHGHGHPRRRRRGLRQHQLPRWPSGSTAKRSWVEGVNLTNNTVTVMRAPATASSGHAAGAGSTSPTTRSATRSRAHRPSVPSRPWWVTRSPWP